MSRTGASPKSPAPMVSADTDEVLAELGYAAGEIAQALIAAGRAANEPAAIVANAARADQSVTVTSLAGLGEAAAASPVKIGMKTSGRVRSPKKLGFRGGLTAGSC